MITPSYSLTATERVLPRLALDFTTAALDPRVTFTRLGNTATVTNSSGVIVGVNADIPRFDYNPTTLVCNGLLIEESRTNVLLNSLIDGTILGTQTVVVTAAARTLSFYGTGQIVLSGAHSATVIGTGAYPTRTTFTFTPTAGALTLTVTGTVQFAQLELGSFATSFIPTAGVAVTRNADVATMTGTNFSDWFNATEGAFQCKFQTTYFGNIDRTRYVLVGDASLSKRIIYVSSGSQTASSFDGVSVIGSSGSVIGQPANVLSAYSATSRAIAANGNTTQTGTTVVGYPATSSLNIGSQGGLFSFCGWVQELNYWPQRLTNAENQAFSK
jgi:hypothetical protein